MAAGDKLRETVAKGYTLVEDVVYIGLGLLLAAVAIALLVAGVVDLVHSITTSLAASSVIALLDRILLVLLIVELLYTVQVSFREHALAPEPFLLVGLISAIRRVLLLTAMLGEKRDEPPSPGFTLELGVLAGLILALAVALYLVRKIGGKAEARRA